MFEELYLCVPLEKLLLIWDSKCLELQNPTNNHRRFLHQAMPHLHKNSQFATRDRRIAIQAWQKGTEISTNKKKRVWSLKSEARIAWQSAIRKKVHLQQQKKNRVWSLKSEARIAQQSDIKEVHLHQQNQNRVWRSNLKLELHDNVP